MSVAPQPQLSDAPAGLSNTQARFGGVAKAFHWLTALLILSMIPLGIIAEKWPFDTSEALAAKAVLFSTHKTLGLLTFAVALARILWALVQPRPAMLPIESRAQAFAAAAVHWALYGALVLVPLTGWIHHAASTGFAPIWWPFGQGLFFVPQSVALADTFATLHFIFNIVLVVSLILHIGGALKHHLLDRDATLKRMLPGTCDLPLTLETTSHSMRPALAAGVVWIAALGGGLALGLASEGSGAVTTDLAEVSSEWAVQSGSVSITVSQLGQDVQGQFADWTAAIEFDETPVDGRHGFTSVTVAIPTLTLGSVTEQALSADFLSAGDFGTATFEGPILPNPSGDGFVVDGTFTLVGQSAPLSLPFDLVLDGDMATATGQTTLDRRSYGIGESYPDESTVGFNVVIDVALTATRGSDE